MLSREYRDSKGANTALLRNLAVVLLTKGSIKTTEMRAKRAKRFVEYLISKAREGGLANRRRVIAALGGKEEVTSYLFDKIAPRFQSRASGFTRIIRIGERRGDSSLIVKLELLDRPSQTGAEKNVKPEKVQAEKTKRAVKRLVVKKNE